jgi:tetratricopeptide (TPR) repeat protein
MRINIGHVVAVSAVLGLGAFVYVVGFAPMDETRNPRAGAMNQVPSRQGLIGNIRRQMGFGQLEAADRLANTLVQHNSEDPSAFYYRGLVDRAMGDSESALVSWTVLNALLDGLESWEARYTRAELDYFRAWGLFGVGEIEESRAVFGELADGLDEQIEGLDRGVEGGSSRRRGIEYNLACYRAMAGEFEAAMEHWEQAVLAGYGSDAGWWAVDPDLEPMHGDDRFWAIGMRIEPGEERGRLKEVVLPDGGADEETDEEAGDGG